MTVDANSDETGALTRNGIIHSGSARLAGRQPVKEPQVSGGPERLAESDRLGS
jgi:hypothetical protein